MIFFYMTEPSEVGDGTPTLFWKDRWLHGKCIKDLAPSLFAILPNRRANKHTDFEALTDQAWITDIQGATSVHAILEYLELWDILSDVVLQPDVKDTHIWRSSASGKYTTKLAYDGLFQGYVQFRPGERIWRS